MLTVPGSSPTTRVMTLLLLCQLFFYRRLFSALRFFRSNQFSSNLRDCLGIQDQIVAGKEPRHARLVQFGLEVAHSKCAEYHDTISFHTCVIDVDSLDAQWGHGIEIDCNCQRAGLRPG